MPTLADLQAQMADPNPAIAIPAANALTNYFVIYNDEYNTLLTKRHEAETRLFDVSHDPNGIDHAEVFSLQSLILGTESRMKIQDGMMIAFQASGLSIAPPSADLVAQVRQLSAAVSAIAAAGEGIKAIMEGLGQIAGLINQVQAG